MADAPNLPLELIFHIIGSLVSDPRTILRQSHPTTRTLRSLALVCRATYPVAVNYLRQNCVYVDNDRRLRELIYCLEATGDRAPGGDGRGPALRPITSMYLAPFGGSLDDQPTAVWVRELLCLVRPSLARLIVDMPLRSLYPADDHLDVRKTLRAAFCALAGLEELVCVRDELYLDVQEPGWRVGREREVAAWTFWPRLKRLALYNVDADLGFWRGVRGARQLEQVVLTRADGLVNYCLKSAFLGVGGPVAGEGAVQVANGQGEPPRPLKVILVNVSNSHPEHLVGQWRWDKVDPGNLVTVMTYDVPTSFYGDECHISLCQEWVKAAAVRGDLWEWEGTLVRGGSREAPSGSHVFELEA